MFIVFDCEEFACRIILLLITIFAENAFGYINSVIVTLMILIFHTILDDEAIGYLWRVMVTCIILITIVTRIILRVYE